LLPHLIRAVRLGHGTMPADQDGSALRATLDRLHQAVLLIDGTQRIAWSNIVARRLLHRAGALRLVEGRIDCVEAGDRRQLRAALEDVGAGRRPTATLAIGRWSGMALHMRIERLARDEGLARTAARGS
jgi:hypothetical protein